MTNVCLPRKGRNAIDALEDLFSDQFSCFDDTIERYLRDEQRPEDDAPEILSYNSDEERYMLDTAKIDDITVQGYEYDNLGDTLADQPDQIYAPYDVIVEQLGEDIGTSLKATACDAMKQDRYSLLTECRACRPVQWAVMGREIRQQPETVFIPEQFSSLTSQYAERRWNDPDTQLFTEGRGDSEEVTLSRYPGSNGIYMYVSGQTAAKYGLTTNVLDGGQSRLGVFERSY